MSLITRCPACATQFKVGPDQLKLSDGWVRCGHCSDVFDATRYLENRAAGTTPSKPAGAQPTQPALSRPPPAQPSARKVSSAQSEVAAPTSQVPQAERASPLRSKSVSPALRADVIDVDLTLDAPEPPPDPGQTPLRAPDGLGRASRPQPATTQQVDRHKEDAFDFQVELQRFAADQEKSPEANRPVIPAGTPATPPRSASLPDALPARDVDLAPSPVDREDAAPTPTPTLEPAPAPEPGFVRQARRRAFWRSPGVRALLAFVLLLLSALLITQWALQERDRLAARYPDLQPQLARLCEPLGCTINAVRDLQAVVIDSATLTRRIGDFYSFDLVINNTSALALAVPALELTLTDTADTVISRRVFLPDELPGVPPLLPPQSTVSVGLRLSLAVGGELPMAGYRALVFYP